MAAGEGGLSAGHGYHTSLGLYEVPRQSGGSVFFAAGDDVSVPVKFIGAVF
jgi:hypothetical protein